jgi:hypothetical protein
MSMFLILEEEEEEEKIEKVGAGSDRSEKSGLRVWLRCEDTELKKKHPDIITKKPQP